MAGKTNKEAALRSLVEEQLPNFRFVERVAADSPAPRTVSDAVTPDLATLRRKYLGQDAVRGWSAPSPASSAAAGEFEALADSGESAEIVLVEPKNAGPRDRSAGAKAVVISKGKIIGMQG